MTVKSMDTAVHVANLCKEFRLPDGGSRSALDMVSFDLSWGTSTVIVGPNGAGKSTLLKLIAGISLPTSGSLRRPRRTTALIELGLAFEPELNGLENADLALALHAVPPRVRRKRIDRIVEHAGIRSAITSPLKHYSDGMRARLAISVALETDPDLLLIDEVFSVGDHAFVRSTLGRIRGLVETGSVVLLVTHDPTLARAAAERAIWVSDGHMIQDGPTAHVLGSYLASTGSDRTSAEWQHTRIVGMDLSRTAVDAGEGLSIRVRLDRDDDAPGFEALVETLPPIGSGWWMRQSELSPSFRTVAVLGASNRMSVHGAPVGSTELEIVVDALPYTPPGVEIAVVLLEQPSDGSAAEGWDTVVDEARAHLDILGEVKNAPLNLRVQLREP